MTEDEGRTIKIAVPLPPLFGGIGTEPPALDLSAFGGSIEAAAARCRELAAERQTGFLSAAWPADTPLPSAVWSNDIGLPMQVPTVEDLLALKERRAPPPLEEVIITPSLDALRAAVPFVEAEPTLRRSPTDFRTTDGIRVVVTHLADRPRLIPARLLRAFVADGAPAYHAAPDQADTPTVVTAEEA